MRNTFSQATFKGDSIEVQTLIDAVNEYKTHGPKERRAAAYDLYLRLIWSDHVTISFHQSAITIAKHEQAIATQTICAPHIGKTRK